MSSEVRTFASLRVGDIASLSRTVTAKDIASFAGISGDYNELHTDTSYARTTQFGQKVVHGMFLGALVSQLVGMQLPGKYCLLVKETLEFKKPVFIGDTIVVTGKISRKTNALQLLDIAIDIKRDTDVVATGTVFARVLQ